MELHSAQRALCLHPQPSLKGGHIMDFLFFAGFATVYTILALIMLSLTAR